MSWSHTFDRAAPRLVVYERSGTGSESQPVLYVRWWRRRLGRRGVWAQRSLRMHIRDGRGAILPELEAEALRRASQLHRELVAGSPDPLKQAEGVLPLGKGLERYLTPGSGRFATPTRHQAEMVRAARQLEARLGRETPWNSLGVDAGVVVWRGLASESGGSGRRWAEQVVGLLYAAGDWLRARGKVGAHACPRPPRWRAELRADWEAIVGARTTEFRQPARYSEGEAQRLLRASEEGDPRMSLLIRIGMGLRLGQVVRLRRTDIDLAAGQHGRIYVPGNRTKLGAVVDMDPELRARLEGAWLHGYLAEFESEFQRERIEDYCLFPSGRSVRGVARVRTNGGHLRPISRSTLRRLYAALEVRAGVRRPGRGAQAMRRLVADISEDVCHDSRTVSAVQGWAPGSAIRQRRYQERQRETVLREAAQVRSVVRERILNGD